MEKVQGIGGVFLRARDPAALKAWYAETLGLEADPVWMQPAGPTVFAQFGEADAYFPTDRPFMLNFRVADLDAMIVQLEGKGVAVTTDPDWNGPVGRFARITDPEGNPVELWQMAPGLVPPG